MSTGRYPAASATASSWIGLEAQRSIIGGTVIATGTVSFTAVGTGFCTSFTAAQVFVELADNGLVGLLSNIDPANGSFRYRTGSAPDRRSAA